MGQIKNIKLHIVTDIKIRRQNNNNNKMTTMRAPAPAILPDEPPPKMVATQEEMIANRVPLEHRDFCAHLFIPLNHCRRNSGWLLPWSCKEEKAEWDECQIQHYYYRMREMERLRRKQEAEKK